MITVLVNAYAVNPCWGSEQGMGWNWIINIARYCEVYVITEGEFKENIEKALAQLSQKANLHFYYNPLPDKVRKMCWNQGDWRFYWYYRKWQKKTLHIARQIVAENSIDIIHQLNMIGFREPGYLWKIKEIPFVWGPIGGMETMPLNYLKDAPVKQRLFNLLKNAINRYQYTYSSRVRAAIFHAEVLISAVKCVSDILFNLYKKNSFLISETGVENNSSLMRRTSDPNLPFKLIWVGKFDFRKQLPIALRSVAGMGRKLVELHICGTGSNETVNRMKHLAEIEGIASCCHWYGNVSHDEILKMMASADLMFFTSIMEATSTVVLEAITVGLPVLCFNTCGFGPIVKDFAGVTVELSTPEQSIHDFSRELLNLYENRHILNTISDNIIRRRVELTWMSKAEKVTKMYKALLDKKDCKYCDIYQ